MGCSTSSNPKKNNTRILSLQELRKDVLLAHNSLRKQHKLPPVQLSDKLNTMAQTWADNLAETNTFQHSPQDHRKGAGENLAGHNEFINGEGLVQMWSRDQRHSMFGERHGIAHVTYDLCKDWTHMGLGRSRERGSNGMYIYVANYLPGNDWVT
ncbi:Golgi-associated plant pathogenesis-related protein 1 [Biomphalaria pfeifferi]|uniref:Golgi-associated plant pathogenesis-related protein 1 n=1 Tax=Biomphalaria pfeifferi TaxID=112525 RepID=A0AAD8C103_BIOPF|nr:Golgi-associated plant pathogenesis-related protein 1 [Biomphalaria pfeifferi]